MYYVIVKADSANLILETSETNNTLYRTTKAYPDLVIYSMTVPAVPTTPTFNVTVTTKNQGTVAAPASLTRLYLSTNSTWDTLDTVIGSVSVPVLPIGGTWTATVPVTPTVPAARYYVIAKADALLTIPEYLETNNTRYATTTLGPDLIISAMTVPANFTPGATLAVPNTVKNNAAWGTSTTFNVAFYLSVNTVLDAADTFVGARAVAGLPAWGTNAATTYLTMPAVGAGSYYLIAKADAPVSLVVEGSETNNTAYRATKAKPDLIVYSLSTPAPTGAGRTLTVTDVTKNIGGVTTPPTWTGFYLSTNTTWDAGDYLLGARAVPPLGYNVSSSFTSTFTVPVAFPTGLYYLIAKADYTGVTAEALETNNTKSVQVKIGPDLIVYSLTAPTTVYRGGTYTVGDTVKNQGGGNALLDVPGAVLHFDEQRARWSGHPPADARGPGVGSRVSYGYSTAATIPPVVPPGTYYLIAVADYGGNCPGNVRDQQHQDARGDDPIAAA